MPVHLWPTKLYEKTELNIVYYLPRDTVISWRRVPTLKSAGEVSALNFGRKIISFKNFRNSNWNNSRHFPAHSLRFTTPSNTHIKSYTVSCPVPTLHHTRSHSHQSLSSFLPSPFASPHQITLTSKPQQFPAQSLRFTTSGHTHIKASIVSCPVPSLHHIRSHSYQNLNSFLPSPFASPHQITLTSKSQQFPVQSLRFTTPGHNHPTWLLNDTFNRFPIHLLSRLKYAEVHKQRGTHNKNWPFRDYQILHVGLLNLQV
jgi:hypothetical protein